MSHLVLSSFFINHPLPTYFGSANKVGADWRIPLCDLTDDQLVQYAMPLKESCDRLGLDAIVLHDGLPNSVKDRLRSVNLKFVDVALLNINKIKTNAYDARFYAYRSYLQKRVNFGTGTVTLTDVNDSVFSVDPGKWFDDLGIDSSYMAVCGAEQKTIRENEWWTRDIDWMPEDYQKFFLEEYFNEEPLCCGTIIARQHVALAICEATCKEIDRVLAGWKRESQPPRPAEIHAFNVICRRYRHDLMATIRLNSAIRGVTINVASPVTHGRFDASAPVVPEPAKKPDWIMRPDTQDAGVWASVYDQNEYRLPASMADQLVLDIGMHIGSFSSACRSRGASEVWAVESDIDNLRIGIKNFHATPGHGTLQTFHAGVWRSDRRGDRIRLIKPSQGHTGCGRVLPDGGDEVPSIELDILIKAMTDHGVRRVNWLKIDCEGAEWPILFTSKGLHLVDNIVGEYHAGVIPDLPENARVPGVEYSLDALKSLLERSGFEVEILPPNMGWFNLFFARRVRFGNAI